MHQTQILQTGIGDTEASRAEQTIPTDTSTQTDSHFPFTTQHTQPESDSDSESKGESLQAV